MDFIIATSGWLPERAHALVQDLPPPFSFAVALNVILKVVSTMLNLTALRVLELRIGNILNSDFS